MSGYVENRHWTLAKEFYLNNMSKEMKKVLLGLIVCLYNFNLKAQQESLFTHYMYNTSSVNPAYAGSRGGLSATLLNRIQWIGFEGAPITQTLNVNAPLWRNRLGLGISLLNDKIGPSNSTLMDIDFAYRMKLSDRGAYKKMRLNFGLKGGLGWFNSNMSSLKTTHAGDQLFAENVSMRMLPNFGFGMLLQHDRFYFGVSSPKLLEQSLTGNSGIRSQKRHYYAITGAVVKMKNHWIFKPSILVKYVQGSKVQGDVTAQFVCNDKLNLGLSYRSNDGIAALIGFQISDNFTIGYSFDYSNNVRTGTTNFGSHELLLRYELIKDGFKSPRYF